MKNVTLKDVARAAGVSYSTVSRSLSGSPQIGRETRERILRLCDEMGYTKNYVARSMVMRRTELIGLVVPSIDNQFMAELAYHAEMSARARGYNLMLCNSGPDLRQEKAVVKLLVGRQVDGMLIVPQEHRSCEELRVYTEQVPTVFLSEDLRDEPLSCVTTDNTGATYLAMEYLRSLGHREILYFGRRHTVTHQLRAEGYLRACRDMGLTPRIVDSSFPRSSVAGGYELARELFTKPLDYTAILASTDSNALGILRAAEVVDRYAGHGFSGLVVTDHLHPEYLSRIDTDHNWDHVIDHYLAGYRASKARGDELGLDVILGAELRFPENDNDYLVYGIDEAWLRANPYLCCMSAREFYRKFHDQVLIVHAHPYRDGNTTVFEDAVHGTEILNAHPRHENHNDRALELAKRHPEYLRLAGSDTHEDGDECRAGVLLPERVRDSFAYRRMIEGRCFRLWSPVFPELAAADEALRRAEPAE